MADLEELSYAELAEFCRKVNVPIGSKREMLERLRERGFLVSKEERDIAQEFKKCLESKTKGIKYKNLAELVEFCQKAVRECNEMLRRKYQKF